MKGEREKILRMVAESKISASEGEELIEALDAKHRSSWRWVINPFDRLFGTSGLLISLLTAGLALFLAVGSGVRFDGALDVHLSGQSVTLLQAVADQFVSWGLLSGLFWITSLILARQGRLVDFVVTVGVARLPLVLLAAVVAFAFPNPNALMQMVFREPWHPMLWLTAVFGLAFSAWFIALLYNGYKVASGLRRRKHLIGSFVWGLVVAEIGSKILLLALPQGLETSSVGGVPAQAYVLPGETFEARAEALLNLAEGDEFDKIRRTFSPVMAEGLSRTMLEWTWRVTRWKRGELLSVDERRIQSRDGFHIVDLFCSFENDGGVIRVVFDSEGLVSGLWFLDPQQALPAEFKSGE